MRVVGAGGAQSYTSKHGYPVTVDVQAEAVSAVEFDAVVVPGGYAPDMMRRHASMVKLVREGSSRVRRSRRSSRSRTTWSTQAASGRTRR